MKNNTVFYIVRHGQTVWNIEHKVQGHTDSPLTEIGLQQAENLAKTFRNIQFDVALSSDLLRAKKTAEIITLEKKLAITTTEHLREQYYGQAEGKSSAPYVALWEEWRKLSDEEQMKQRIVSDAESDEEVATRFITFLREAAVAYPGKTVLIVSHGSMMCTLLVKLGFASYTSLIGIENCGWYRLESDGIDFFLKETFGVTVNEQK